MANPFALHPLRLAVLAALVLVLTACARDREAKVRTHLEQWFFIGESLYFKSEPQCTAAIYRLTTERPKPSFVVQTDPNAAKEAFAALGIAALQMEKFNPSRMIDGLVQTGNPTFGKRAMQSGSLAKPCFKGKASTLFFTALTQQGATVGFESANEALIIIDPYQMAVFYVAGDVW